MVNPFIKNETCYKKISFLLFKTFSRFGFYVLPVHYHVPLANVNLLEKSKDVWTEKSELPAIDIDLDKQVKKLREICLPYQNEYLGNQTYLEAVNEHFGPGYGYIEAQALYGFIRHYQPERIIEVGSGVSTYCMLKALEMNTPPFPTHLY